MGALSHDVAPTTLVGLWRAAPRRLRVVVVACLVSAALALLVGGGALGRVLRPKVVVKTETKVEVRTQVVEKQVVVERPVIQWRDRVIERVVYRPDGTKRSETTVTEQSGRETGGKTTTTETATSTDTKSDVKTETRPLDAPRLHGFVELSIGSATTLPLSMNLALVGGLTYDVVRLPFIGASWFVGGNVFLPLRLPGGPVEVRPPTVSAVTGLGW